MAIHFQVQMSGKDTKGLIKIEKRNGRFIVVSDENQAEPGFNEFLNKVK